MKKILILSVALLMGGLQTFAGENWLTDFNQAKARAKETNKPILALFTGSDWCPPCKKLHSEVMETPEFEKYAADNVVLLEVDFPMKKPQTKEQKKANAALERKYDVEGYPTIVIINEKGKAVGTVNYGLEGPKDFIAKLDKVVKKAK